MWRDASATSCLCRATKKGSVPDREGIHVQVVECCERPWHGARRTFSLQARVLSPAATRPDRVLRWCSLSRYLKAATRGASSAITRELSWSGVPAGSPSKITVGLDQIGTRRQPPQLSL